MNTKMLNNYNRHTLTTKKYKEFTNRQKMDKETIKLQENSRTTTKSQQLTEAHETATKRQKHHSFVVILSVPSKFIYVMCFVKY